MAQGSSIAVRPTLLQVWWPDRTMAADATLVLGMAALTALSAQVQISLWFTPVPITGQTFAFLLAGAVCGRWRGGLSQVLYIVAGAVGLPVFAGGVGGFGPAVMASGGYIVGGLVCAFAVGWLAERYPLTGPARALWVMVAGEILIYACGLAVLSRFVPGSALLRDGLLPFIPGDVAKMLLATACLPVAFRMTAALRR